MHEKIRLFRKNFDVSFGAKALSSIKLFNQNEKVPAKQKCCSLSHFHILQSVGKNTKRQAHKNIYG